MDYPLLNFFFKTYFCFFHEKTLFFFLNHNIFRGNFFLYLLGGVQKKISSGFLFNDKIKKKEISTLFLSFNIPPLTKFGN